MSWARLDDQMTFHRKILEAGNEAVGAWVRMITHSCAYLTDGRVTRAVALSIAGHDRVIQRLVKAVLLDVDGDDFVIHDFHEWNPPAEKVRQKRRADAERKAAGRANQDRSPSGQFAPRHPKSVQPEVRAEVRADVQADSTQTPVARLPVPVPVPVPVREREPPVAPLAAVPGSGRIPDGNVSLERGYWIQSYEAAVRESLGDSAWTFQAKQFSALRPVVEALCVGEDRQDIPAWIGRTVTQFVRAVRSLDDRPGVWSGYGPDGLQRWFNEQKPGLDGAPSATRLRARRPPLQTVDGEPEWMRAKPINASGNGGSQ